MKWLIVSLVPILLFAGCIGTSQKNESNIEPRSNNAYNVEVKPPDPKPQMSQPAAPPENKTSAEKTSGFVSNGRFLIFNNSTWANGTVRNGSKDVPFSGKLEFDEYLYPYGCEKNNSIQINYEDFVYIGPKSLNDQLVHEFHSANSSKGFYLKVSNMQSPMEIGNQSVVL